MRYARWTPAEDDALEEHYGLMTAKAIGVKIGRTEKAVQSRADRLGLSAISNQDAITVAEAAKILGISHHLMRYWVRVGKVVTLGDWASLISYAELDRLKTLFPALPANSMTLAQAGRALGYSHGRVATLARAGVIRGVKFGRYWHLDADHVEAIRRSGLNLDGNPAIEAARAKGRQYLAERRAKAVAS